MERIITFAARLVRAGTRAYERKWSFLGVFVVIFVISTFALAHADLLPNKLHAAPTVALVASAIVGADAVFLKHAEEPVKIEIVKIGLTATITNPTTTDSTALDEALLKGAVRYPTSAKLGEVGNVVLFGHSSYLPVVINQAYKTFNGIQKLSEGDPIAISSAGMVYTYQVRQMQKESAASDAGISLTVTGRVLTLATCDSFGAKSDRFVVTADFVESHLISI